MMFNESIEIEYEPAASEEDALAALNEIEMINSLDELLLERELITPELLRGAFEPTLVRASAGTGKTYQLTARLLKILLTGAPP